MGRVIKRGEIVPPVLPKETLACAPLGGDVVVRGMTLSERLQFLSAGVPAADDASPSADSEAERKARTYAVIPRVLSWCVLDADSCPVMSAQQWEWFGVQHTDACLELFHAVRRLSLIDREDAEKKSARTPS